MSHQEGAKVQQFITPEAVGQTLLDMVDIRSPTGSEAAFAQGCMLSHGEHCG